MRRALVLQKTLAHRIACLSLYRALLRQCGDLARQTGLRGHRLPTAGLKEIVRFRFRRDGKVDRPLPFSAIINAIQFGRSQLTLLREATAGSTAALIKVIADLDATSADLDRRVKKAEETRPRRILEKDRYRLRHDLDVSNKELQTPPTGHSVLDAPLPLSRIRNQQRKVPHLVVTSVCNIPMLRYKIGRPPPWLRRILRQKQKWGLDSIDLNYRLVDERDIGSVEDNWEDLLFQQAKQEGLLASSNAAARGNRCNQSLSPAYSLPDFEPNTEGTSSYGYWPWRIRRESFEVFVRRRWEYAVRGWELWQKVKREKWLEQHENVHRYLAAAVGMGQRLQNAVVRYAEDHGRALPERGIRSVEEKRKLVAELMKLGPLHVPVEWSERVVDKERPDYLHEENALRGANMADLPTYETSGQSFSVFGAEPGGGYTDKARKRGRR